MKTLILIALSCFFYLAEAQQITFEKTYGSGSVSSMALCSDGGYIVAINQDTVGRYVKLDSYGNVEWERSVESLTLSFEMYPNPNNGTFTINRTSAPIGLVEIYDATGRQVYKEDVKNTQCQLKLTVEPGVYSVKIGSAFKKTVINT